MRVLHGEQTTWGALRSRGDFMTVRNAPIVIREATDRICGKRLKPSVPLLVEAMERHKHLQLAADTAPSASDECRDDRSGSTQCGSTRVSGAGGTIMGGPAPRSAANLLGSAGSTTGFCGGRSGHTAAHKRATASYRHWFSLTWTAFAVGGLMFDRPSSYHLPAGLRWSLLWHRCRYRGQRVRCHNYDAAALDAHPFAMLPLLQLFVDTLPRATDHLSELALCHHNSAV
jgi:hypothetical protein